MIGAPSFPLGAPNKRRILLPGSTFLSGKLTNGLVGWWEFGVPQLTGTSVPDLSGTGNTGTLTNTPTKVPGRLGRALNFVAASNQYVALGSSSTLNLTGSISIAAWINPATTGEGTNGRIFDRKASVGGYGFVLEGTLASNALEFIINAASVDGATFKVSNANAITMGVWQHVAVVYDSVGQTATFYVNGVNAGGGALTSSIVSAITPARIGARSTDNLRDFDGKINSVRVYNRTLSVGEIRQLSQAPLFQTAQPIDKIWAQIAPIYRNAALTKTLDNLTVSSAGTVLVTGTATPTIPAITSASTGTVLVTGTGVSTIPAITLSSTGGAGASTLSLSQTIDPITSSSAGTVLVSGTTSATVPPITSSSTGTVLNTGALAATIDPITSSSTATVLSRGALSSTLGNLTASSAGTVLVQGVLSQTIGAITLSAAVGVGFVSTGTLVKTLGPITVSSAGKVRVTGSATPTLADLTSSSTGKVLVKGSLTATIGPFRLHTRVINPNSGSSDRYYLQIPRFNIASPPSGDDLTGHLLEKLRQQQVWLDALSDAVPQSANTPPLNPRFGTLRYATGDWALTLGSPGLYIFRETGWQKII